MYKINFTLGDWSGDGHRKSESFLVESNKPVEELREIHFTSIEKLGFDVGSFCSKYGENFIEKDTYYLLKHLNLLSFEMEENELNEEDWLETKNRYYIDDPENLLIIWLNCLSYVDPSLSLVLANDLSVSMHFYGTDQKGRHLRVPGYGLY